MSSWQNGVLVAPIVAQTTTEAVLGMSPLMAVSAARIGPADLARFWGVIHTESQPSQATGCGPANFTLHGEFGLMLGQVISNNGPVMAVSATGIGRTDLAPLWGVIYAECPPNWTTGPSPANFIQHAKFRPMLGRVILATWFCMSACLWTDFITMIAPQPCKTQSQNLKGVQLRSQ